MEPPAVKAILVGEAWGKAEAQMQHPLVGPSGRELSLQMGIAEFAPFMLVRCRNCKQESRFMTPYCEFCKEFIWPNEFHLIDYWKRLRSEFGIAVTNVFNEHPPDSCKACGSLNISKTSPPRCLTCNSREIRTNDLGWFFGTERETSMTPWKASKNSLGTHLKAEHFYHIKRLWREIEDLDPNLIICLGNAACWALLHQTKITSLRGTVSWSNQVNKKILPTFHPAAVLRQMSMRPTALADFQKAKREIEFPEIKRPERWITLIDPTEAGLAEGYSWFNRPANAYAVDIETFRGQITMVGFARTAADALVIQLRTEPIGNYWPTDELEFRAWRLISHGLASSVPKIFQNGLYDISYFLKMGIQPRNCAHDTMLWHHSKYPELPKSLGYLGSLYANEVSWKLMRRHGDSAKRDE